MAEALDNLQSVISPAMLAAMPNGMMQDDSMAEGETPPPVDVTVNLAERFDDDDLGKLASQAIEDFQTDENDRAAWLAMHAKWLEVYHQQHKPDVSPWVGSSTDSFPLLTEACHQFQARAYKAFFPSRQFVSAIPMDDRHGDVEKAATRVAKHLSFKLGVLDRNYKADKNQMFLASALHGSDFTKTYWHPVKKKTVVERVRAVDLVVPYGTGPRRIEDIERKTHVIRLSLNTCKKLHRDGYFIEEPKAYNGSLDETKIQKVEDKAQGQSKTGRVTGNDTCLILEQHRLWDFDGDGLSEPYIVWIDAESKKVLRVQIRYEVDEAGESVNDKEPKEFFTHYQFLPNPNGFYGLGYGHLIGNMNISANKMLRQIIDAGTLANIGNMSGFISARLGVQKGDVTLDLGKFTTIEKTVDDIRKGIYQFQFPGPNPAAIEMMQMIEQTAQRASSTTDAITGDVEKVMQPLTIMTMLEQSLQLPTSIMEQLAQSFEDELDKIFRLERDNFEGGSYFMDGQERVVVTKEDYDANLRIVPVIDPKQVTRQQKIAKAQALYEFAMSNPEIAQNPSAIHEVSKRVLEAMDTEDTESILPDPPEPLNIDDQRQENMLMLMPAGSVPPVEVFPEHDHMRHIAEIDKLIQDPVFNDEIPDEQKAVIFAHRQKHIAYQYGIERGVIPDGQGRVSGMGAQPGNPMDVQAATGGIPPGAGLAGMSAFGGAAATGPNGGAGVPAESGALGLAGLGTERI